MRFCLRIFRVFFFFFFKKLLSRAYGSWDVWKGAMGAILDLEMVIILHRMQSSPFP